MKMTFLGTGAADWDQPDASGEIRRFSSALLDGALMLDAPATALELLGPEVLVQEVLLTHGHRDHFCLDALRELAVRRRERGASPLIVHVEAGWAGEVSGSHIQVRPLKPLEPFQAAGYEVLPLPANHVPRFPDEQPVHYRISRGGRTLVYATDGAWMPYGAVAALRAQAPFDALVIDATIGDGHDGDYRVFEHNSLPMVRMMVESLRANGQMKAAGQVYLTHLARTLHPCRRDLEASLAPPYRAAYDGMTVEI